MLERVLALTSIALGGRPVACHHAVLIARGGQGPLRGWSVAVLGLRPGDLAGLRGRQALSAVGSHGERLRGTVEAEGPASRFYVCLRGSGPLRLLVALDGDGEVSGQSRHSGRAALRRNARVVEPPAHQHPRAVPLLDRHLVHQGVHKAQPATVRAPDAGATSQVALSETLTAVLHTDPHRAVGRPDPDRHRLA